MKAPRIPLLVAILIMGLAALACGGSISTAKIVTARMAADREGTQETAVFTPEQAFYCIVELANGPRDTQLKAVWTAVQVEGQQPGLLIDQAEITSGDRNVFTFDLTNEGPWPAGQYKVDLYLDDKLDRTLEFEVR